MLTCYNGRTVHLRGTHLFIRGEETMSTNQKTRPQDSRIENIQITGKEISGSLACDG